ncbi:hypothetical protein [Novosphingobium cyanobacteriorum]|uniref:Hpr(Ser) kinase/phosphatase n=1 Tax=Novosphingobium cyanobacteriorum TaxID=3024215 RepID=A0ABT6CG64_9SPHN|nr:hypothetical protein [Novosphingobium cyanobacteriorum]MDF8332453.1 hypothetical protein [Novosphingobium cyanobacteriorum]
MMFTHAWRLYGLVFAGMRPIAGLEGCAVAVPADPDVTIIEAPVTMPAQYVVEDFAQLAPLPQGMCMHIEEAGTYLIENGNRITVDRWPGATDREVDIYLTGSALGILLHQRALLPIHCNAVAIGGRAFLFCGDSGAGKSTLAAWFERRGHPLLTDDLCAVQVRPGQPPLALPGMPRMRLWRQSLELLGRPVEGLLTLPWEDDKFEAVMVSAPQIDAMPIGGIYHLLTQNKVNEPDPRPSIQQVKGLAAAEVATANIYRRRFADHMGRTAGYLASAMGLIGQVPVFSFRRNWGLDRFESESRAVEEHARGIAELCTAKESMVNLPAP